MATKNTKNNSRQNVVLKVQPHELNLTDLKELLQKSKSKKKEKIDKKGKIIGYSITSLGIITFISSLLINRLVDREYFPDSTIIFIMGVSIFILVLGFYILAKETR